MINLKKSFGIKKDSKSKNWANDWKKPKKSTTSEEQRWGRESVDDPLFFKAKKQNIDDDRAKYYKELSKKIEISKRLKK